MSKKGTDPEVEEVQEMVDEAIPYAYLYDPESSYPYRYLQGKRFYDVHKKEVTQAGKPKISRREMRECAFCEDEYFMTPREMKEHMRDNHAGGV